MKRPEYRIWPGWYLRYVLQRRHFFIFWTDEAASDDASELRERVAECGGFIRHDPRAALKAAREQQ